MSVEMQTAFTNDMAIISENGEPDFVDNKEEIIEGEVSTMPEEEIETETPDPLDNFD